MSKTIALSIFFVLSISVTTALPADHFRSGQIHRFSSEPGEEINFISFSNGFTIDTRYGEPSLPVDLRLEPAEARYFIVQFTGPIQQSWFSQLKNLGVKTIGYLPYYATIARLTPLQREQVAKLPFVRWTGVFQPAYKIQAELLNSTEPRDIAILVTPGELATPLEQLITLQGGTVVQTTESPFGTVIQARLSGWAIPLIARAPEAFWIQEWTEPSTANNHGQWVTQSGWRATAPPDTSTAARPVWRNGVRGQGVILSTTDTGLNLGHDMFRDPALPVTAPGIWPEHRKVVAYKKYGTADATEGQYHGSHVNGTVAGDDSITGGTSYYDGMSIKGRLYFVDLTNGTSFVLGTDLWTLWDTVYFGRGLPDSLRPIKQHSGSWGWSNSSGTYLLQDASTDAFIWAHKDFLNIMAAGNEYSTRRIRNPGIAKNVLTVGALQNGTASNTIASFSSRGPTQDGRLKPSIMAPGEGIYSATRTGTNTYQSMDGTSMATPMTSGAVGLIRCYLQEGFYPTGTPTPENRLSYISAALLRSMTIASADPNIGSYTPPDNNIGWGRIDVDSVLYFAGDNRKLLLKDDTIGIATGEYAEQQFLVEGQIPLRVALAWSDTAAAPNANPTLVNNLDLELISPTGTYYRGNKYSAGQSIANPTGWDSINTEECCRINAPDTGVWTIRVYGRNVATSTRQPFAWTITGALALRTTTHDAGVMAIITPNGDIDSGTVITPQALVKNYGTTDEDITVVFNISSIYTDTQTVTLAAGATETLDFTPWTAEAVGTHTATSFTTLVGDENPGNDTARFEFEILPGTGIQEEIAARNRVSLAPAEPNPFRNNVQLRFNLPVAGTVKLQIFSVTGELVANLLNTEKPAGTHTVIWNGNLKNGKGANYGVFYCRLTAGNTVLTRKLIKTR
ncbi:MAG: S8 family serine peptidase [candidate division WOR-3 bacterium]|nr:S8 family serine peptidase [candidate division WOR-3 bacterium]MDH7519474.1 S8 family serine peptidase [bacterium]